jgi:hypothetical protein
MKRCVQSVGFFLFLLFSLSIFAETVDRTRQKSNGENIIVSTSPPITMDLGNKGSLSIKIKRLADSPIIYPEMDSRLGSNINGPSLIRVPDWVEKPLGKYYLYFAAHKGKYIRLAYADRIDGPWKIHEPGTLKLEESGFLVQPPEITERLMRRKAKMDKPRAPNVPSVWADATYPHIASPDIHVLAGLKEIRMYYHGLDKFGVQSSRVAVSKDGLNFKANKEVVTINPYLRVFQYNGYFYGMAMPGFFFRSKDGLAGFERGVQLFDRDMRHSAFMILEDTLLVFWTQVTDSPEHIKLSIIDISKDWKEWKESPAVEILRPEYPWEGADLPAAPSFRSSIDTPVNQLRDPAIFQEGGRTFLLYATAGESGIGIVELLLDYKKRL